MGDHHSLAIRERPPSYDGATCSHRHTILATAVAAPPEGRSVPVTLYHWSPPSARAIITIIMSPRGFSAIKGFTPLGTFLVADYLNMSKPLSELLATSLPEHGPDLDPTPQLLADLVAQLPKPADQGELLLFFSFPVFSNSPDQVLSDGPRPAWKWSKPNSAYRKAGSWGADLDKVLEDGEWGAGKDLLLLVKGMSDQAGGKFTRPLT
ncbi:hypothetical protein VTK56DRAFT_2429 [Thermocarpiscus australiensis]